MCIFGILSSSFTTYKFLVLLDTFATFANFSNFWFKNRACGAKIPARFARRSEMQQMEDVSERGQGPHKQPLSGLLALVLRLRGWGLVPGAGRVGLRRVARSSPGARAAHVVTPPRHPPPVSPLPSGPGSEEPPVKKPRHSQARRESLASLVFVNGSSTRVATFTAP